MESLKKNGIGSVVVEDSGDSCLDNFSRQSWCIHSVTGMPARCYMPHLVSLDSLSEPSSLGSGMFLFSWLSAVPMGGHAPGLWPVCSPCRNLPHRVAEANRRPVCARWVSWQQRRWHQRPTNHRWTEIQQTPVLSEPVTFSRWLLCPPLCLCFI